MYTSHTFSEIVDPSTYDTEGLCEGIPLRTHKCVDYEKSGISKAQNDWSQHVYPIRGYLGGIGPDHSFISVTVPECLPERLEIISYANEFAFLYDDAMEQIESNEHKNATSRLLDIFGDKDTTSDLSAHEAGAKLIQRQIFDEMISIDRERAITSIKAWSKFVQLASSRQRTEPFASLEEYLPYRIIDAGEMIWFGTVTFGMALTIPSDEMESCRRLSHSAFAAISLTNDLYSWPKELAEAKRDRMPHVVNAIWVLMRQYTITEHEAQHICRQRIKEYVTEFRIQLKEMEFDSSLSLDLKKYIAALQYSLSGNLVWSIYCPRYGYKSDTGKQAGLRII